MVNRKVQELAEKKNISIRQAYRIVKKEEKAHAKANQSESAYVYSKGAWV